MDLYFSYSIRNCDKILGNYFFIYLFIGKNVKQIYL